MAEEIEDRKRKRRSSDMMLEEFRIENFSSVEKNFYIESNDKLPSSGSENALDSEAKSNDYDDSLPGELTPCENKQKEKKSGNVSKDKFLLAPFNIRDIPLPPLSWVDSSELTVLMCFKEDVVEKDREPNVFKRHPNLTPRMRAILFDWLMEVCDVYKLRRVTYYLAIDYVDRYLSRVDELPKNQLQLLGITCLFIAAKVEEIYPPKLTELAYVTDGACTDQEMLLKEMAVLKVLNWDVSPMTVSGWLNLYMQICYNTKSIRDCTLDRHVNDDFVFPQFSAFNFVRASHLIDFCSLDDGMLNFQYSTIAASAIYYIFNRERALYVSGFTWEDIKDCVQWMEPFYRVVHKIQMFGAFDGPKERHRGSSGLKKLNPNIIVNEAHSIQTHVISLGMLEDVYKLTDELNEEG